ncbi:hypothetical protein KSS87_008438 [Heliosperma pusillum]|nr:hypothetical protein KSS87_008438 [Heliosperma pusillum]
MLGGGFVYFIFFADLDCGDGLRLWGRGGGVLAVVGSRGGAGIVEVGVVWGVGCGVWRKRSRRVEEGTEEEEERRERRRAVRGGGGGQEGRWGREADGEEGGRRGEGDGRGEEVVRLVAERRRRGGRGASSGGFLGAAIKLNQSDANIAIAQTTTTGARQGKRRRCSCDGGGEGISCRRRQCIQDGSLSSASASYEVVSDAVSDMFDGWRYHRRLVVDAVFADVVWYGSGCDGQWWCIKMIKIEEQQSDIFVLLVLLIRVQQTRG